MQKYRTSLRQGEKLLLVLKAHWIVLNKPINVLTLHCLVAFGASLVFPQYYKYIWGSVLVSVAYLVYAIAARERNLWVVTDQRIIDEAGVFSLYSKESPLSRINNISYYQSLFGRMLDYGDVSIQTAAEHGETVYRNVARPRLLRDVVANACAATVQPVGSSEPPPFQEPVPQMSSGTKDGVTDTQKQWPIPGRWR